MSMGKEEICRQIEQAKARQFDPWLTRLPADRKEGAQVQLVTERSLINNDTLQKSLR